MPPIVLQNPYRSGDDLWLKGNLHTHTTMSDGANVPTEVIADYERRGYDFLAITDHDLLVSPQEYQGQTSMVLIPGVEVSALGPHILHLGARGWLSPMPTDSGSSMRSTRPGGLPSSTIRTSSGTSTIFRKR